MMGDIGKHYQCFAESFFSARKKPSVPSLDAWIRGCSRRRGKGKKEMQERPTAIPILNDGTEE